LQVKETQRSLTTATAPGVSFEDIKESKWLESKEDVPGVLTPLRDDDNDDGTSLTITEESFEASSVCILVEHCDISGEVGVAIF